MTTCPALVPPFAIVNNVLTNNSTLQVTSPKRDVGTVVTLSCKFNYTLVADSPKVICQQNLAWNFTNTPKCEAPVAHLEPVASIRLSEDQKIILGAAGGVGAVVLVITLIMVGLIVRAKMKKDKGGQPRTSSSDSPQLPPDGYLGSPIDSYPQRFDYPYEEDPYREDTYPREKPYAPQQVRPPLLHTNYDNMAFTPDRDPDHKPTGRKYSADMDKMPDRSYNTQPNPPRDYNPPRGYDLPKDNYGEPNRESRTTPRYFPGNGDPARETRNPPRQFPENGRPQYTNAVKMYKEYGRPQRVAKLENAYGMHMDHRSQSSGFNFATRGVPTPRPIDSYQSRGGDPTRFYRGPQY